MVDKFLTEDLNDLITDVESEKIQLPKWLNIVGDESKQADVNNILDSITSQLNENLYNNQLSATSDDLVTSKDTNDIFVKQTGGNSSDSKVVSSEDINNLIAMLTSDKNQNEDFDTVTSVTDTSESRSGFTS